MDDILGVKLFDSELERGILASIIISNKQYDLYSTIINDDDFYQTHHQIIWKAIKAVKSTGDIADYITINKQLQNQKGEKVPVSYLVGLTNNLVSPFDISKCYILKEYTIKRKINNMCSDVMIDISTGVDALDLLSSVDTEIKKIQNKHVPTVDKSLGDLRKELLHRVELARNSGSSGTAFRTYFKNVDEVYRGFIGGDMITIPAYPGQGKTALIMGICKNNAIDNNVPVLIFSLEMKATQLMARLVQLVLGISSGDLRVGKLSDEDERKLREAEHFDNAPLHIVDDPKINVNRFSAIVRKYVNIYGVKAVFVDYFQLMGLTDGFRNKDESELSERSRLIKQTAQECDVPIFVLSQFSKGERTVNYQKPNVDKIKGTGALEADSDIIIMPSRPEEFKSCPSELDGIPTKNMMFLFSGKFREGRARDTALRFINGSVLEGPKFDDNNEEYDDGDSEAGDLPF
mgnify:CR=1 FL=1